MSLAKAIEPYSISIREEIACHFDSPLQDALSTPLQELTLLTAPYALETLLSSPSSKHSKLFRHLLSPIRDAVKDSKTAKSPELSGTAKAPYDENGKLVLWRDSGVESRITMKKYYGTQGENLSFDSISALPEYAGFAHEELRVQDYADGRTGEYDSTISSGKGKGEAVDQARGPSPILHPVTTLLKDILARLCGFFARLPPGICTSQRTVDTFSQFLSSYEDLDEALQRFHVRLVAGPLDNPSAASQRSPELDATTTEEPAFDFKIRVKQGKQKKRQKQEPSKVINAEEVVRARDGELLRRAGIDLPSTESSCLTLKQELIKKHAEALDALVSGLQEQEVREMVLKAFAKQHGIGAEEDVNKLSNSVNTSSALQSIQPQLRDGNVFTSNGVSKASTLALLHPSIRPLKAARLFECTMSDLLGSWQVYFGSKACSQLRQLDKETKEAVAKKTKQLSMGHFSADNMKKLGNTTSDIPIFEAKVTRDIGSSIKWICTAMRSLLLNANHAQIDNRLWSAVSRELTSSRSAEYRKRIKERAQIRKIAGPKITDVIDPLTFPRLQEAPLVVTTEPRLDLTEEDCIELHDMLALHKWTPWSRSVLNAAIAQISDATHMFLLSEAEQAVVNYESSSFVIGRSGTGKTSCALFRLIGLEESLQGEPVRHRQVFITKSAVLASKIRDYYGRLRETLNASRLSATELQVIAKRRMETNINLTDDDDIKKALPKADLGIHRVAAGSVDAERRRARKMMANRVPFDGKSQSTKSTVHDSHEKEGTLNAIDESSSWLHRVDPESFVRYYWPHFDQSLTKNLDAMLCYAEFIGVIEGGIETIGTEKGYLSKEAYLTLPTRSKANFAHIREQIYEIFTSYRASKAERGDWDAADRTHAILRALKGSKPLKSIDCLFVDEAQDQLLIDTALLRSIVQNPHGHFWAGDTAQTISASSFRFEDLSAAFYNAEKADPLVIAGARPSIQPKMFDLLVNYRSHRGITNIAASLVEIVTYLFPNAIDALGREVGIVDGTLPVVFDGFVDSKDLKVESFLFGSGGGTMEFGKFHCPAYRDELMQGSAKGSEQCIIVRDEKARTDLRSKMGEDFGLILTIYESKGLEFNDVLLWRFFTDSPASEAQWRVILSLLNDPRLSVPTFDLTKHSAILNELRHLYVAVTRARNRLWLFDPSARMEPMKLFLHTKGLVAICKPGDPMPEMAVSSTPEEWLERAKKLHEGHLYAQAVSAYARAGKPHEAAISSAFQQRERARDTLKGAKSSREVKVTFQHAAEMFAAVAAEATAEHSPVLYREAARAYTQTGDLFRAGQCYEGAHDCTEAARLYRKAQHFEDAVRMLKTHAPVDMAWLAATSGNDDEPIEQDEAELVLQTSRLHFTRKNQQSSVRRLFESDDTRSLGWMIMVRRAWQLGSAAEILAGFDTASLDVLESLGQHQRCAELHLERGALAEAATSFQKAGNPDAMRDCLRRSLLQLVPLGTNISDSTNDRDTINKVRSALKKLDGLEKAKEGDADPIFGTYRRILDTSILYKPLLEHLQEFDAPQQLFVLDFALQRPFDLTQLALPALEMLASAHVQYARLLEPICVGRRVTDELLHLLGIEPVIVDNQKDESRWSVSLSSPIYAKLPSTVDPAGEAGAIIAAAILPQIISQIYAERLFSQMQKHCDQAQRVSTLRPPCLSHALLKQCSQDDCGKLHISTDYNAHFQTRLAVLSMHLLLAGHLAWLGLRLSQRNYEFQECSRMRRGFLDLWIQCLFPSQHLFGGLEMLQERSKATLSPVTRSLLVKESLDCLSALSMKLQSQRFFAQLLNYSILAATFNVDRYKKKFPLTRASRRNDIVTLKTNQPFGVPLYHLLTETRLEQHLSVDVVNNSTTLVQSYLHNKVPIDLNAFCSVFETLTIMVILGDRQSAGKNGFAYLTLPEALARQAVLQFSETRIQMYQLAVEGLAVRLADVAAMILGDARFIVDGGLIKGLMRPLMAVRLLRLLALLGWNRSSRGLYNPTQKLVLDQLRRVSEEYHRKSLAQTRRLAAPHHVVSRYLTAKGWPDVQSALQDSSSNGDTSGQLVQLFIGPTKTTHTVRGIRVVAASSVANLARRWRGEPEVVEAPPNFPSAWSKNNLKPSDAVLDKEFKGLVPSQIVTRSAAAKTKAAEEAAKPMDAKTTSPEAQSIEDGKGKVVAEARASTTADVDEGFARSEEVPSEEAEDKSGDVDTGPDMDAEDDTTAIPVDFSPLKELEAVPELTKEQIAAAMLIKNFWLRSRKRRNARVVLNTPRSIHLFEMLAISRRIPFSGSRMACISALLFSYIHVKTVFDIALKEVDATKKKSSRRLQEDHVDLEELHGRITAINNLRKRFMNVRKSVSDVLPSGDFPLLRTKLEPLRSLIDELCNLSGTSVKLSVKEELAKLCKSAIHLFEDVPPPPTAKKEKRPVLNMSEDLDDDLFRDDDYMDERNYDGVEEENQEMEGFEDEEEREREEATEREEEAARALAEAERIKEDEATRKKVEAETLRKEQEAARLRVKAARVAREKEAAEKKKVEADRVRKEKEEAERLKKEKEAAQKKAAAPSPKKKEAPRQPTKVAIPKADIDDDEDDVPSLLAMSDSEDDS